MSSYASLPKASPAIDYDYNAFHADKSMRSADGDDSFPIGRIDDGL